ncbi:MAG: hypothetical protein FD189_1169 [Elusimicrobia bacterium]|nr:MAG: hypothetical protein FD154_1550 [Elusimicrobiota bacterium]KAF0156024.1 MAG: hypothetical protein FD189_1169 [Elusimicrobiota bacterium]
MIRLAAALIFCLSPVLTAKDVVKPPKYKVYSMDKDYFSCVIPADWQFARDTSYEEADGFYGIELSAPSSSKAPVSISVTYYTPESVDFDGHDDFIRRNSRNVLGETKSPTETYGPVKKATVGKAGAKAFSLDRERKRFLHLESKSEESVVLRETIYVVPAAKKGGFHVLHFSASKADHGKYLPVFRRLVDSFKGV